MKLKNVQIIAIAFSLLMALMSGECTWFSYYPSRISEEEKIYYEIEPIASKEQLEEYRKLSPAEHEEWLERFWAQLDPTPKTPRNERKEIHYERIKYAREFFPSRSDPPGWDNRGDIYIKYGEPHYKKKERFWITDRREVEREVWYYLVRGLLRFEFSKKLFSDEFDLASETYPLEKLFQKKQMAVASAMDAVLIQKFTEAFEHVNTRKSKSVESKKPVSSPSKDGDSSNREGIFKKWLRTYFTQESRQRYYNFITDIRSHTEGQMRLSIDIAGFRGAGDSSRVVISYAIPYEALTFNREGDHSVAGIRRVVRIFNLNKSAVVRDDGVTEFSTPYGQTLKKGPWLVDLLDYNVLPGEYVLVLLMEDVNNPEGTDIYAVRFYAHDYSSQNLSLSNIQFASSIRPSSSNLTPFGHGLEVVPYPSKIVSLEDDLKIYFEIYNLTLKGVGRTLYTTEYMIVPDDLKKGLVSLETDDMGATADAPKYMSIDLKDLSPGSYYLIIMVTDKTSDEKAITATSFNVKS